MAKLRIETHAVRTNWATGGSINIELSPKPYTITELWLVLHANITTTTATNFNDLWDRIIATLSLTSSGRTLFSFTDMRPAYHLTRYGGFGTRRATVVADSVTDAQFEVAYRLHFGLNPNVIDKNGYVDQNLGDLTAGIPPTGTGNLSLTGTFGTTNAPGTNVTIATTGTPPTSLDVVLVGVQPESGDPVEAWMPRAFPNWQMRSPDITVTSSPFTTQDNVPAGDLLHSILMLTYVGTNAPRSSAALSGLEFYDQLNARSILKAGGLTDSQISGRPMEQLTSMFAEGQPYSDSPTFRTGQTATPGVPTIAADADPGTYYLPLHLFTKKSHPLSQYGVDLRNVSTGDFQLRYGIPANSSNLSRILYRKYQLNPDHPANAGL